jgi:AraC-like DNA-binding protein
MFEGRTFVEYITYIRIQNSINLLVSTDLQIIDICLQSGFNNIGHFNKMFKRFTGITPSEYRKQTGEVN